MLIGIYSSVPQSGKSEVKKVFLQNGFLPFSFASSVKRSMLVVLDDSGVVSGKDYLWGDKKEQIIPELGVTGGQLMSRYATFMRDYINKDIWLNIALDFVNTLSTDGVHWVCDDLRNENEFPIFEYTIKVNNSRRQEQGHSRDPKSEGNLDNYPFSYTIDNDGSIEDLQRKAIEVMKDILEGYLFEKRFKRI